MAWKMHRQTERTKALVVVVVTDVTVKVPRQRLQNKAGTGAYGLSGSSFGFRVGVSEVGVVSYRGFCAPRMKKPFGS